MAYGIVHTKSYTSSAAQGIGKEEDRKHKIERNPDIDPMRKHLNITKIRDPDQTLYQAAKKRLEKLGLDLPRKKNQILFEQTVITASPEFFTERGVSPDNLSTVSSVKEIDKTITEWMDKSERWAIKYFGEDNVISMTWHFDETTPHLHVDHLPIVDGKFKTKVYARDPDGNIIRNEKGSPVCARDKNGKIVYEEHQGRKLSRDAYWKERGGRNSYRMMQQSYYDTVSIHFGLERGERSEETLREHIEQQRYKAEAARTEISKTSIELESAKAKRDLAIRQSAEMADADTSHVDISDEIQDYDLKKHLKRSITGNYLISSDMIDDVNAKLNSAGQLSEQNMQLKKKVSVLSDRLIKEENRQIEYTGQRVLRNHQEEQKSREIIHYANCWIRFVSRLQHIQLPDPVKNIVSKILQSIERETTEHHNHTMSH